MNTIIAALSTIAVVFIVTAVDVWLGIDPYHGIAIMTLYLVIRGYLK